MDKEKIVKDIADYFKEKIRNQFTARLNSFYIVGSYAFGKISKQRPDINFLLIFKDYVTPEDYLKIGKLCKMIENQFSEKVTIKFEFRPFRYIKPMYNNDFEVSINPIITSTNTIKTMGNMIFNKWFTQGMKSANKLILGEDLLSKLKVSTLTREDLRKQNSLNFFYLPLSRAPAQYSKEESNLLLNEALVNAKNTTYFGVEAAMTNEELSNKEYLNYVKNKNKMIDFYKQRYDQETANKVKRILEIRENYLDYKDNPKVAKEVFGIALDLIKKVRQKVYNE